MPRVNRVKSARKEWKCGRCGTAIEVGQPYMWAKTRYGPKMVRCPDHPFRPSELVSSDKLQRIFGAQEMAQDAVATFRVDMAADSDPETVNQALQDLADELEQAGSEAEEVGEEYQESADNLSEYFPGSEQVDEIEEKATNCEDYASSLADAGSTLRDLADQLSQGQVTADDAAAGVDEAESAAGELEVY